mmetsp:Transcript_42050/g.121498  ORF Transcript_42050/g.121498 Transcript_42050/m.121498 type:complete len:141 (-) Transcript_42050:79-501(-)
MKAVGVAALLASVGRYAAAITVRGAQDSAAVGAFDCYVGNGADYRGLHEQTKSGRACKNWLKQDKYPPGEGIGSHSFCRNPEGSKEAPWCYTVDPAVEFELCDVPECEPSGPPRKPWKAPEGAKSEEAEAEGPCEPEAKQ